MRLAEVIRTKIEITGFSEVMDSFGVTVEKYGDL
jgi:hypothetical protein